MVNNWSIFNHFRDKGVCLLCGATGHGGLDLCPACEADLPWLGHACPRCALPIPTGHQGVCGQCLQRAPPQERSCVALRYDTPLPFLISGLKFHSRLAHARLLGQLLTAALKKQVRTEWPEVIIPVPLHRSRLRERGFNQAQEIARVVSRQLRLPLDSTCCVRQHATLAQSDLDARARQRNLRRAFAVKAAPPYKYVAIVDDVMTTGTTVMELARTLRHAGVERVEVWTAARAVKN